jgi:hypothetical protein
LRACFAAPPSVAATGRLFFSLLGRTGFDTMQHDGTGMAPVPFFVHRASSVDSCISTNDVAPIANDSG